MGEGGMSVPPLRSTATAPVAPIPLLALMGLNFSHSQIVPHLMCDITKQCPGVANTQMSDSSGRPKTIASVASELVDPSLGNPRPQKPFARPPPVRSLADCVEELGKHGPTGPMLHTYAWTVPPMHSDIRPTCCACVRDVESELH